MILCGQKSIISHLSISTLFSIYAYAQEGSQITQLISLS